MPLLHIKSIKLSKQKLSVVIHLLAKYGVACNDVKQFLRAYHYNYLVCKGASIDDKSGKGKAKKLSITLKKRGGNRFWV
jgi:hypothetical protein